MFEMPKMTLIKFEAVDVLTTSTEVPGGDNVVLPDEEL